MKMLLQGSATFALGAILFIGTFHVGRKFACHTNVWSRSSSWAGPDSEQRRAEELEIARLTINQRIVAKCDATEALLRGEIDLREAGQRFRAAMGSDSPGEAALAWTYPAASGDELYYRNVIAFVHGALLDRPDEAPAILADLEAQLSRILQESRLTVWWN